MLSFLARRLLSTLPVLGSYRLQLQADATGDEAAALQLTTTTGALQLSGSGQWAASKFRFSGQASAAAGAEAALNNLLNIIGRRKGALSLISIG
jgi:general secretion pathway protein N